MKLKDKVAIITGGGTGIGRTTAILFAKEGAKVIIVGRRQKPLEETVDVIKSKDGKAIYFTTDVSKADEVQKIITETIKAYGKIDILYNNAAVVVGAGKTMLDLSEEEWDTLMAINLKSVFLCSKYVIPHMIKNGGGVIINCSSTAGHIGQKKQCSYSASKGGVELLTKCMALDFAEYNIRVNAVCPGLVKTERNKKWIKTLSKPERDKIIKKYPIGRIGQPIDVAYAVLYLASDESSWTTGTSLMVDGGYTSQ